MAVECVNKLHNKACKLQLNVALTAYMDFGTKVIRQKEAERNEITLELYFSIPFQC